MCFLIPVSVMPNGLGELADRRASPAESLENDPPRGIRESAEGPVDRLIVNHQVQYAGDSCACQAPEPRCCASGGRLFQHRLAPDLLAQAVARGGQAVTQSVTDPENGVVRSRPESPGEGVSRGKGGSGGRTRTYDQAVNSPGGPHAFTRGIALPVARACHRACHRRPAGAWPGRPMPMLSLCSAANGAQPWPSASRVLGGRSGRLYTCDVHGVAGEHDRGERVAPAWPTFLPARDSCART